VGIQIFLKISNKRRAYFITDAETLLKDFSNFSKYVNHLLSVLRINSSKLYIYAYVCVCVCVWEREALVFNSQRTDS
jgi:hypothetical protein